MRIVHCLFAFLLLLPFCAPAARADTIQQFDGSGYFYASDGALTMFGGTLAIDTTLGQVTAADFTVDGVAQQFTTISKQGPTGSRYYDLYLVNANGDRIFTYITTSNSLVDFTGADNYGTGGNVIISGQFSNIEAFSLTPTPAVDPAPAAVTPEPSSLVLLGTGLLSLAGVAKARFSGRGQAALA